MPQIQNIHRRAFHLRNYLITILSMIDKRVDLINRISNNLKAVSSCISDRKNLERIRKFKILMKTWLRRLGHINLHKTVHYTDTQMISLSYCWLLILNYISFIFLELYLFGRRHLGIKFTEIE